MILLKGLCLFFREFFTRELNIPPRIKELEMAKKGTGFVRTHFFIDKKFQGRYMLTFLIPMFIMLLFMLGILYLASQTIIQSTIRTLKQNVDSKIVSELQDTRNPAPEQYKVALEGVNEYIRTFADSKEYQNNVLSALLWVVGGGLLLVIIQIVLLTVFFSHKVAGPIYRFEKACNSVIEGDYTSEIKLRKGDEMQNLAALLNEAIRASRDRLKILSELENVENRKEIISKLEI
jgi:nitrate/nitrite-specific signal transduction histidine kinase